MTSHKNGGWQARQIPVFGQPPGRSVRKRCFGQVPKRVMTGMMAVKTSVSGLTAYAEYKDIVPQLLPVQGTLRSPRSRWYTCPPYSTLPPQRVIISSKQLTGA